MRLPFTSQIDRYILRQLLVALVAATAGLTVLIWLTQSLRFVELVVNRETQNGAHGDQQQSRAHRHGPSLPAAYSATPAWGPEATGAVLPTRPGLTPGGVRRYCVGDVAERGDHPQGSRRRCAQRHRNDARGRGPGPVAGARVGCRNDHGGVVVRRQGKRVDGHEWMIVDSSGRVWHRARNWPPQPGAPQ